jgi:hypothetical protein
MCPARRRERRGPAALGERAPPALGAVQTRVQEARRGERAARGARAIAAVTAMPSATG